MISGLERARACDRWHPSSPRCEPMPARNRVIEWACTRTSSDPVRPTLRRSGSVPPMRSTGSSPPPARSTRRDHRSTDGSPTGELNVCYNALDRHVDAGRGTQAALVYDLYRSPAPSARTPTRSCATRSPGLPVYSELGVGHGDRVVIYMPMVPEAAVAMLACARIGAVHSVVFGGFAPRSLPSDRRRGTESDRSGVLRHRGQAAHRVQAAVGQGDRDGRAQTDAMCDPAAPTSSGLNGPN